MQVRWGEIVSSQFLLVMELNKEALCRQFYLQFILTIYFKKFKQCYIRCKIGATYLGVFSYADDLTLLCPSISDLKEMLKICEGYASDYNIIFDAKKSKLINFGRNKINFTNIIFIIYFSNRSNGTSARVIFW